MPSNKDRLYISLYARGGGPKMPGKEDTYHWALMVGPKEEPEGDVGTLYHAKERGMVWQFEERETSLLPTQMLLVRVMIAKVENRNRFEQVVRNTPIREGTPGWNCVSWVEEVLQGLEADGKVLGTGVTEWTKVRNAAMEYCKQKKDAHRFDGKGNYNMELSPTYDLVARKETIP